MTFFFFLRKSLSLGEFLPLKQKHSHLGTLPERKQTGNYLFTVVLLLEF